MERKPHVEMSPAELSLEREVLTMEVQRFPEGSIRRRDLNYQLGRVGYEISCRIEIGEMLPVIATEKEL